MSAPLTEDLPSDSSYESDDADSDDEDDYDVNNSSDHSVSNSIDAEDFHQDDAPDSPPTSEHSSAPADVLSPPSGGHSSAPADALSSPSGKRSSAPADVLFPPALRQRLDDDDLDSTSLSRKVKRSPTRSSFSRSSRTLLLSPPKTGKSPARPRSSPSSASPRPVASPARLTPGRQSISSLRKSSTSSSPKPSATVSRRFQRTSPQLLFSHLLLRRRQHVSALSH